MPGHGGSAPLREDARLPDFVARGSAHAYDFADNTVPGSTDRDRGYWRDVGTIDSYFDAHLDLTSIHPVFNLYNYSWPINTHHGPFPPAKFVHADDERAGGATNSIVSPGVVVSGGHVDNSVLSPGVFVHSYSHVRDSVLLDAANDAAAPRPALAAANRLAHGRSKAEKTLSALERHRADMQLDGQKLEPKSDD